MYQESKALTDEVKGKFNYLISVTNQFHRHNKDCVKKGCQDCRILAGEVAAAHILYGKTIDEWLKQNAEKRPYEKSF